VKFRRGSVAVLTHLAIFLWHRQVIFRAGYSAHPRSFNTPLCFIIYHAKLSQAYCLSNYQVSANFRSMSIQNEQPLSRTKLPFTLFFDLNYRLKASSKLVAIHTLYNLVFLNWITGDWLTSICLCRSANYTFWQRSV